MVAHGLRASDQLVKKRSKGLQVHDAQSQVCVLRSSVITIHSIHATSAVTPPRCVYYGVLFLVLTNILNIAELCVALKRKACQEIGMDSECATPGRGVQQLHESLPSIHLMFYA